MKIFFWDMDGVLIDSLGLDLQVVNPWLREKYGPGKEVSREFIRQQFAYAIPEFCRNILMEVGEFNAKDWETFVADYEQLRRLAKFELCPGVKALLSKAQSLGVQQWVVSNNKEKDIAEILEKVGIRDCFERIFGYDSCPTIVKKPAPDIYLNAFEAVYAQCPQASEFVVFEDSIPGVESATQAKQLWKKVPVRVVAVATGGDDIKDLQKADQVVPTLESFSLVTMEQIYILLQQNREPEAKEALVEFLRMQFSLNPENLCFLQSAVSLNSFKGEFESDGKRYFFKTHIEAAGEIREYAGAKMLEEAGYPMIVPAYACVDRGRELLVYPFITEASIFELVAEAALQGKRKIDFETFSRAQNKFDQQVFEVYQRSFRRNENLIFPSVQQLFYLRLNGSRFQDFYQEKSREFGGRQVIDFESLSRARWIVNGKECGVLGEAIERAKRLLTPEAQLPFTVVGHGDAHNGNVFYGKNGLRLFDPAYAGRMDPFLDLTKPLFHNVFARWMYFPQEVEARTKVDFQIRKGVIEVTYDYELDEWERLFLQSKMENVLKPLVEWLRAQGDLPSDWQDRLRSSLLCCPLLTVNLFDEKKYSPAMAMLGFARVMEMASFRPEVHSRSEAE